MTKMALRQLGLICKVGSVIARLISSTQNLAFSTTLSNFLLNLQKFGDYDILDLSSGDHNQTT